MVLWQSQFPKVSSAQVAEQLGLHDLRFKGQYHVQAASAANGGAVVHMEGRFLVASRWLGQNWIF